MARIYTDVEVSLDDFEDEELLNEIINRGLTLNRVYVDGDTMEDLIEDIYNKRRLKQDYEEELDRLMYYALGRVV